MLREALVLPDGESFSIREIAFSDLKQQRETHPCVLHEPEKKTHKGSISYTLESATVSFRATLGGLSAGRKGQMSSNDQFYEVTVLSVDRETDHFRVTARAERTFDLKVND
jgi:hypothetical protein